MLHIIPALLLILIYGLRYYQLLSPDRVCDFSAIHEGALALYNGNNPYALLVTLKALPFNLNPPFLLWLFQPLSWLPPRDALILWSILSLLLGTVGAGIAFHYAFEKNILQKNRWYLYGMYWACFATLMNTSLGQLGGLLLFLTMSGYHFYKKNRDILTGLCWGGLIAIKLFPALLFVYVFVQKRYRLAILLFITVILLSALPYALYGPTLYAHYIAVLTTPQYAASWNASLYGFLFRIMEGTNLIRYSGLKITYALLFLIITIAYVIALINNEKKPTEHRSFCLTLTVMLFLSPLGWLYYLPLLILPLALTYLAAINDPTHPVRNSLRWLLCLFLLNFPMTFFYIKHATTVFVPLTLPSFYCYGLVLLMYLTKNLPNTPKTITKNTTTYQGPLLCIFIFSMLSVMIRLLKSLLWIH